MLSRVVQRLIPARLLLVLIAAAVVAGPVTSQNKEKEAKPKPVSGGGDKKDFFATTPDGVRLLGDYYPAADVAGRPKLEAPCVLLLHGLRAGASRKDFGALPARLQAKGFAVLTFDFRGYGQSTSIDPDQYFTIYPSKLPGSGRKPKSIGTRDFRTLSDWLALGNDIEEAKLFLNKKSDARECNSNNLTIVGAEQGALLGMIWTAHGLLAQQERMFDGVNQFGKLVRGPRTRMDKKPEGEDVNCIITLSMHHQLGRESLEQPMRRVLEMIGDKRIGVLVLYGEKDVAAHGFWTRNYRYVKPEKEKDQQERVLLKRLEKTDLVGTKLLGNDEALKTETFLDAYLEKPAVLKERDRPWIRKSDEELQSTLFAIDQMEGLLR